MDSKSQLNESEERQEIETKTPMRSSGQILESRRRRSAISSQSSSSSGAGRQQRRQSQERESEDNYRRVSFDHRISDDLCQFILQYLTTDDRIRLECVSKQFQRIVLKAKHLTIDFRAENCLTKLEKCLQKFPAITTIESQNVDHITNEAIELIIKFCPNFTQFKPFPQTSYYIDSEVCIKFMDKFGLNLISADFYHENYRKFWTAFVSIIRESNIERLNIFEFNP